MGYTTNFDGAFKIEPGLSAQHKAEIEELADDGPPYGGTKPESYLQWTPNKYGTELKWDGGEKFYLYIEWLRWLSGWLKERDYKLNGEVLWSGEDLDDRGKLVVTDNDVRVFEQKKIVYEETTFQETTR